MTDRDRIVVDAPPADASRDRVEARVFSRLDAIRAAERGDVLAADLPRSRARWFAAAAGAVAVAIGLGLILRGELAQRSSASAPSLVVTPVGGSSRFTVDDAVVDAGSDTQVEVRVGDRRDVTFVLDRGTIDCDVAPRRGRPLQVRAGDVVVEVVGTRFSVTRAAGVQVDVTHGTVRVRTRTGEILVGPGERWSEREATSPAAGAGSRARAELAAPPPAPSTTAPPAGSDETAPPPPTPAAGRSSRAAFQAAQRLEVRDRRAAARAYRAVAAGNDAWAALALYSLAELDASSGRPREALADVDEYLRRFPRGAGIEDVLWIRVENLRALGRPDDARAAAAGYLRRFPHGTYVKPAARVAVPP